MSGLLDPGKVLFVGVGQERISWYRCALPALFMGADWAGLHGIPPRVAMATGYVHGGTTMPNFDDYDVIVLQQPFGRGWLNFIRELQGKGKKVVYEIDDYLHGIRKMADHDFAKGFTKDRLAQYELCMRVCDAMICSTSYIARRYAKFNKRVYLCENGLDMGRYKVTRPPRGDLNGKPAVMIGWAGATGHSRAAIPWLNAVLQIMREYDNTCFVTIGQGWAQQFANDFPNRAISIPFTLIEQYPAAMTLFDIALAPAGQGSFSKGKSQLRFYESAALGVAVVGDPDLYDEIDDGVTGLHAQTKDEVVDGLRRLIEDASLRLELGTNAMKYVWTTRNMGVAVDSWRVALEEVACS